MGKVKRRSYRFRQRYLKWQIRSRYFGYRFVQIIKSSGVEFKDDKERRDVYETILRMFFNIEFYFFFYNYLGFGIKLEKRLKRGDVLKNRFDVVVMQYDIVYFRENISLYQKYFVDLQMVDIIGFFKNKSLFEKVVSIGLRFKVLLGFQNLIWFI